jgi:hypothetical protein
VSAVALTHIDTASQLTAGSWRLAARAAGEQGDEGGPLRTVGALEKLTRKNMVIVQLCMLFFKLFLALSAVLPALL